MDWIAWSRLATTPPVHTLVHSNLTKTRALLAHKYVGHACSGHKCSFCTALRYVQYVKQVSTSPSAVQAKSSNLQSTAPTGPGCKGAAFAFKGKNLIRQLCNHIIQCTRYCHSAPPASFPTHPQLWKSLLLANWCCKLSLPWLTNVDADELCNTIQWTIVHRICAMADSCRH